MNHRELTELKATKTRLELVLEGTRLGMWDWNPQTDEVCFDERWAEMLGVTLNDLSMTLEDWTSRVHPDDIQACFEDIQAHIDGKVEFYENTHRMKHADGSWRYILDRGRVVERDTDGLPTRFTGTHTDVTALKQVELTAQEALADRDKFFTHISHELRTPLHGILGTAEVLEATNEQTGLQEYIDVIKNSGSLLLALLNDLLDIAKLSSNSIELHPEEVDLLELARHTVQLFAPKAREFGLTVTLENNTQYKKHLLIESDRLRLSQILTNLVSNAIKFTESGSVKIVVDQVEEDIIIRVIDSGIGIEHPERIFDEFTQEYRGQSLHGIHGTGLGLAIVKNLCDLMDVPITCESVVNQGTEFCLKVGQPISLETFSEEELIDIELSKLRRYHKAMVVDDNEINLLIAKFVLKEFADDTVCSQSGEDAIEKLKADPDVDLVLMDINMPGMNGYETTKRLRKLLKDRDICIIAQTANNLALTQSSLNELGFDGSIGKPFERSTLIQVLRQI